MADDNSPVPKRQGTQMPQAPPGLPGTYPEQAVKLIYEGKRKGREQQELSQADLEAQSMWYFKEIDVGRLFPLSRLYALRQSFLWMTLLAAFWTGYFFLRGARFERAGSYLIQAEPYLFAGTAIFLCVALLYFELYRATYRFSIDGFRFIVTRGVLFRERGSLPILPVSEIYIQRNVFDFLFHLGNLKIITPLDQSKRWAMIEGLPLGHAYALQQFLTDQLNRQIFIADIPHYNKETGEQTAYRRFYTPPPASEDT